MNIVLISSGLIPRSIGGVEVLTLLLAKALHARGHKVTILTGGKERQHTDEGVCIHEIPQLLLPLHLKGFFMPVYELLLKNRLQHMSVIHEAHVVNAMDIDSILMLTAWNLLRGRFIPTIQDYGIICPYGLLLCGNTVCPLYCRNNKGFRCIHARHMSIVKSWYLQRAYTIRKRYRDTKLIQLQRAICVSDFVSKQLLAVVPRLQTTIIGNCIDAPLLSHAAHHILHRPIDVLFMGRLVYFKGIEIFLAAIKVVLSKKNIRVVIVGQGKTDACMRVARGLGIEKKISVVGAVAHEKTASYYQQAKIVVVPSLWPEPCGRVIIEAMAHGCIVVGTKQGGTPELIQHGKTGYLVDPNNPISLSVTIHHILDSFSKLKHIQLAAYAQVHTHNTPNLIAKQYEHEYKKLRTA